MDLFTIILYVLAVLLLGLSSTRDKQKTILALKRAWKSFENILPQFLSILIIIGIILAWLSPATISKLIGQQSGWVGMVIASLIGSVTLIPGFVAFPLAAALLESGAGFMQIAVFISTLMMVGVITLPLEIEYFGRKAAVSRNLLAYVFSFIVAIVIGVVLK